jgi:hypothetical protein
VQRVVGVLILVGVVGGCNHDDDCLNDEGCGSVCDPVTCPSLYPPGAGGRLGFAGAGGGKSGGSAGGHASMGGRSGFGGSATGGNTSGGAAMDLAGAAGWGAGPSDGGGGGDAGAGGALLTVR